MYKHIKNKIPERKHIAFKGFPFETNPLASPHQPSKSNAKNGGRGIN